MLQSPSTRSLAPRHSSPEKTAESSENRPDNTDSRNITLDIIRHAKSRPESPALLMAHRDISYRELDNLTWKFAHFLHEQGVRPGHIIGLTLTEEFTLVLCILAVTRLGATVFSIPRSTQPVQRIAIARKARIYCLAGDQVIHAIPGTRFLEINQQALISSPMHIDLSIMEKAPRSPWLLISGSGTTGEPKLIPVTHAQAAARATRANEKLQITAADRIAPLSHFDFSHAKFRLHEALAAGASCALNIWDTPDPIGACIRFSLSAVFATVFHAEKMLQMLAPNAANALTGVRVFEVTSSTVTEDLRRRLKCSLTPNVHVRYGINEAGPVAIASPDEINHISGTIGRALRGTQVEIIDRNGQVLPAETIGLIRISSPGVVEGYLHDDKATQRSFIKKWFLPGDLGKLTADGHLIFYGRADHMMIMNGINIYPAEIEQVLTAHPDVTDCAVVPARHPVHQDLPIAAVTLSSTANSSESALLAYACEQLGSHAPWRVIICDQIPRNNEGKLIRSEMNGLLAERLGISRAEKKMTTDTYPALSRNTTQP
ncbi:class I adenylate-forming enzyme family protein [Quatrionicoccus australiensis]|uniref:class I adenylate-forming enzyme family protein n=1 Tax=Quatrionicoccus australiensis TaxID=138118 RepID=UPI001CF82FC4|nr:class I adenylate-forming enzyme family protein [Quatrionicoccus australiensis]